MRDLNSDCVSVSEIDTPKRRRQKKGVGSIKIPSKKKSTLSIVKLVAVIAVAFMLMVPFFGSANPMQSVLNDEPLDAFVPVAYYLEQMPTLEEQYDMCPKFQSIADAYGGIEEFIEASEASQDEVIYVDTLEPGEHLVEGVFAPSGIAPRTFADIAYQNYLETLSAAEQFSNPNVREPFGGNAGPTGAEVGELVVMATAGDPGAPFRQSFPASAAGLTSALQTLYDSGDANTTYIVYIGADITGIPAPTFANGGARGTFSGLAGSVAGIVLTGGTGGVDPITTTAVHAAPAATTRQFAIATGGTPQSWFGSHVEVRNLRHNFGTNMFMNGYHLTLGGGSWQLTATSYFGGSNTGTITPPTGSTSITVYSTGSTASTFVGGMQVGTINGDTSLTINGTSNSGTITVRGGGVGTSATARADVNGNVSTTITGLATGAGGGLAGYIGGAVFGNISGSVTNNISGPGRFANSASASQANINDTGTGNDFFVGGSSRGNIGSPAITAAGEANRIDTGNLHEPGAHAVLLDIPNDRYAIFNYVDTQAWNSGRHFYVGANGVSGDIRGDVINVVRAGTWNNGSYTGMMMLGGWQTIIGGTWHNGFTTNSANGHVTIGTGVTAAHNAASFRVFGNTTSVIRGGSISQSGWALGGTGLNALEYGWFRGSGVGGYIRGDVYAAIGTESVATARSRGNEQAAGGGAGSAYRTSLDIVGGGGRISGSPNANNILNVGDLHVVMAHTYARWTYGGGFYGVIIGDTTLELHRGSVDTLEGTGYRNQIQIGSSHAEVRSGRVNWFLTGGSWWNIWQHGNTSVTVQDATPAAVINASLGGLYGLGSGSTISGDSHITIHGGHFGGSPRLGPNGISPGPAYNGTIFGNATTDVDLRGNEGGFSTTAAVPVSAGRKYGRALARCSGTNLGTNVDNVNVLNVQADAGCNLLQGLTIFGDTSNTAGNRNNTRAGRIVININAPGANLGTIRKSNYDNLQGGLIHRDTEVNIVSAGSIQGIQLVPGLTNAIVANSAANARPRAVVVNVGPHTDNSEDLLGERQIGYDPDPLFGPHTINVAGTGATGGIRGYTEMNINERLLNVTAVLGTAGAGSINHTGVVTNPSLGTAGGEHGNYGVITVQAGDGVHGAGFGVAGNITGAGAIHSGGLIVEGEGTAYIQSPGAANQSRFRYLDISDDAYLYWLKVGNVPASTFTPTTWFGMTNGWHVLTTVPLGPQSLHATPFNTEGIEPSTGRTFIGDNFQVSATDGRVVAIPASIYRWNVTEGEGVVSHNVPVTLRSDMAGLLGPPAGHLHAIGDQGPYPNTSTRGRIAIPADNIPNPILWPEFTFRPYAPLGEWLLGAQIIRTDHNVTTPAGLNSTIIPEDDLRDYFADFLEGDVPRNIVWRANDPLRTANPDRANDRFFGHDMTIQFTSEAEIEARSVLITESEAAAIANYRGVLEWTDAAGRPWFRHNITDAMLDEIREPLAAGVYARPHPVTYTAGRNVPDPSTYRISTTVNVTVVRDGSVISDCRQYGIFATNATMAHAVAQTVNRATLDADYTRAVAFNATGATFTPNIAPANVVADINSTTTAQLPRDVDVTYTFSPGGELPPVSIDVVVTIVAGTFDFIFTKFSQNGTTPLEGVEFNLYPPAEPGPGWDFASPIQRISDVDGVVTFDGLDSGTFLLREYRALAGYQSPMGYWHVTINANAQSATIVTRANAHNFTYDDGDWSLVNFTGGNVNWTVSKEISGNMSNPYGLYNFRLHIVDAAGNPVQPYQTPGANMIAGTGLVRPVTTVLADGTTTTANMNLAVTATGYVQINGFGSRGTAIESFTIQGLPSSWQVRAVELNPVAGYEVTFVDSANPGTRVAGYDTGLLVLGNANRSFDFRNRLEVIPTGLTVANGTIAIAIAFTATIATMAALSAKRRRDIEAVPALGAAGTAGSAAGSAATFATDSSASAELTSSAAEAIGNVRSFVRTTILRMLR